MIVPAVSGLASKLSEGLSNSASSQTVGGLTQGGQSAGATGSGLGLGLEGNSGLQGTRGVEGIGGVEGASGGVGASGGGSGSFGSELSEAISSLEGTQLSSDSAAQSLATGTAKDPESAVVTVEDAQMAMDLASQLRTKATEAAQNLFQTQV
ncbi:MAG: flagellar hook-basal body complex protein FliE [Solirubrobacteraceae bacterium]